MDHSSEQTTHLSERYQACTEDSCCGPCTCRHSESGASVLVAWLAGPFLTQLHGLTNKDPWATLPAGLHIVVHSAYVDVV